MQELLGEYGVAPHRLTLEINEDGVLVGTDRPLPTLRRLRDIGVRLSVDDFGTGYSSLSLPAPAAGPRGQDRPLVRAGHGHRPGRPGDRAAVVDLSRHFGLTVVAEGVESELTLELLEDIGCDIGQGFLFSRPLPYERLEAWLAAQTEAEPTRRRRGPPAARGPLTVASTGSVSRFRGPATSRVLLPLRVRELDRAPP